MTKHILFIAFFIVVGCGQRELKAPQQEYGIELGNATLDETTVRLVSNTEITTPRMLIKTGQLSLKVNDVQESRKKVAAIAKNLNAYISDERLDNSGDRLSISMTIRVPSKLYDSLVALIEPIAEKTENKSVNTQDVTEEFIDTEARLKTKKELEARYREILRQANSVTDILAVESNLNTVRGEIESMEGRLKYLSSQVSFSTLSLSFYQSLSSEFGFGGQFIDGLKNGWTNLLSFFIGLVNVWPFLIILSAGIWFFIKWRRRKKIA
jgi:Domain of unknown function (DUF4349)